MAESFTLGFLLGLGMGGIIASAFWVKQLLLVGREMERSTESAKQLAAILRKGKHRALKPRPKPPSKL